MEQEMMGKRCTGISWTTCKSFVPDTQQINMPIFADWMLFRMPNQQCQNTEGTKADKETVFE